MINRVTITHLYKIFISGFKINSPLSEHNLLLSILGLFNGFLSYLRYILSAFSLYISECVELLSLSSNYTLNVK